MNLALTYIQRASHIGLFSTSATGKTAAIQAIEDAIAAFGEGDADIMIAFAGPIGDVRKKAVFGITQGRQCVLSVAGS